MGTSNGAVSGWAPIGAIARRELGFYFNGAIAWVVVTLFLGVCGATLFAFDDPATSQGFFDVGQASLRPLFAMLPVVLIFLVPAISMRLISEERRSGTLELLVSWPVSDGQIVLGKYLGGLGLLAIALLATVPLALLVAALGPMDWGTAVAGYLGSFLVGAAYLALGLMTSAWTRNQIVAYLVSALLCSVLYNLDGLVGLVWQDAQEAVAFLSFKSHFGNITRGVVDSRDGIFYGTFVAIPLVVTTYALRGGLRDRLRPPLTLGLSLLVAVLLNLVAQDIYIRGDLSAAQVNVLSDASRQAARALSNAGGVEVRVYISDALPESIPLSRNRNLPLRGLPQRLLDKLAEYQDAADGGMRVVVIREDALAAGRDAKLRPFTGKGAKLGDRGFELEEYVLGASFHFRNAMETFELALRPEFYEFEITKRLMRLMDKAKSAESMKQVLETGRLLSAATMACNQPLADAMKRLEGAGGLAGTPEPSARQAIEAAMPALDDACAPLAQALDAGKALKGEHAQLDRMVIIVSAFWEGLDEVRALATPSPAGLGDGTREAAQLLNAAGRTSTLGAALEVELQDLLDAPGRKQIGIVCSGATFCPFPERGPLLRRDIESTLVAQNGILAQLMPGANQVYDAMNQRLAQIGQSLFRGRGFDVVRVDLGPPIPPGVDGLVVLGASRPLSDYQLYQLDQFVMGGGSLVTFLNPWTVEIQHYNMRGELAPARMVRNTANLGMLLGAWGISPTGALVAQAITHDTLMLKTFRREGDHIVPAQGRPVPYPLIPRLDDVATDDPMLRASTSVVLPWATPLELIEVPGVTTKALIRSAKNETALVEDAQFPLEPTAQVQALLAGEAGSPSAPVVLMASASGRLPSAFRGKATPAAPERQGPDGERLDAVDSAARQRRDEGAGRVLVVGSNLGLAPLGKETVFEGLDVQALAGQGADFIEEFRQYQANFRNWGVRIEQVQHTFGANLPLLESAMDWSVQRDALGGLRSAPLIKRPLRPLDDDARDRIVALGVALPPLLFLLAGLLYRLRRRARVRRLTP